MLMSIMRRSKIKSENIISESHQITVQTKNLNNEIVSLSSQTSLKDEYIGDVEDSLRLNKQAVNILYTARALEQGRHALAQRFQQVSRQNLQLLEQMRRQREAKEAACAQRLIKQQIRTQDEQFFQERISELDTRVDDLRKTLQDKQYNYYIVAERLSVYEELEETFISYTNYSHNAVLADKAAGRVAAKLSSEKQRLQEQINANRKELKRLREQDKNVRRAVVKGWKKEEMRMMDRQEVRSQGLPEAFEIPQGTYNPIPINIDKTEPTGCVEELLKILKKEKTAQSLIRITFKQSCQVEEKLKRYHKRLQANNRNLTEKMEKHMEHIAILEACMKRQLTGQNPKEYPWKISLKDPEVEKPVEKETERTQFDPKWPSKGKKILLIRSSSQPNSIHHF